MYVPESVGDIARTSLVAFEAIKPFWTHSFLAINPFKSRITYARSIYMVTLCTILAVTSLCALKAVCPNRTLFLTPAMKYVRQDPIKCCSLVCFWLLRMDVVVDEWSTKLLLIYLTNILWMMISVECCDILGTQSAVNWKCINLFPIISCKICIS